MKGTINYLILFTLLTTFIFLTAINADANIKVKGPGLPTAGAVISSGAKSPAISLAVGETHIVIEVKSPNGRFSLGYNIHVTRIN